MPIYKKMLICNKYGHTYIYINVDIYNFVGRLFILWKFQSRGSFEVSATRRLRIIELIIAQMFQELDAQAILAECKGNLWS